MSRYMTVMNPLAQEVLEVLVAPRVVGLDLSLDLPRLIHTLFLLIKDKAQLDPSLLLSNPLLLGRTVNLVRGLDRDHVQIKSTIQSTIQI